MARIPGCIEYNNTIGANKIHPQTSGSGGDQEQLDFVVGVEVVDEFFSVQRAGAAVQSVVIDSSNPGILGLSQLLAFEKIFNEIQSKQGLGEQQNSVVTLD